MHLPAALWGPDPLSTRRFASLVRSLPVESATVDAVNDRQGWDDTKELLALLAELTDVGNRMFFSAHTDKGTKAPTPLRIARPGVPEPEPARVVSSPQQVARFFGAAVRYVPNGES